MHYCRYKQFLKEKFNVNDLLQQAINNLHPLAAEKNANIQTTFSSAGIMVTADKYYMLLTFINLIENAIKYSANPKINISTYTEGHDCCIAVNDNGIGISEENQKKIFNRFFRVTEGDLHTTKGFGLGLNFVKKIVEEHGGKIEVKSEPGIGSTFIIKIPQH